MKSYPRYIAPGFKPFDPVKLAEKTEQIVCRGSSRKYTHFYATGVYRGIATGYTVGCCLRCFYCWVEPSRDFPEDFGSFYTPNEVVEKLEAAARRYGTRKCRISGGEPTIGKEHLLNVLKLVEEKDYFNLFILETNGILFGVDENYVKEVSKFGKVHVRVSLKAGNESGFESRTGGLGKFYQLPFRAIENLLKHGVSFHVAAMTDPRIMPREERKEIIKRLNDIHPALARNLEEEIIDPYETTIFRLRKANVNLEW